MLDTSARLLRLLSLFQARRYWSGAELCERLEVTARTLRRDVDRLRTLGYPVASSSGTGGGYQLGAGAELPPLLLDDDEAIAVALGLRTAAAGGVAGMEEALVRALAKLDQVLPSRLSQRVAALHTVILPLAPAGPSVEAGTLSHIAAACRDQEMLRFGYKSREGAATAREVEPYRLVHTGSRWYLVAWDLGRHDWRTFRVDRIEPKLCSGQRFKPRNPPEGGLEAYVSRALSYAPYPQRARVVCHAPIEALASRIPPAAGFLEAIDEHTSMLHTGGPSADIIAVHLALLGVDFEVLEPPELVEEVRRLAGRFRRASLKQRRGL